MVLKEKKSVATAIPTDSTYHRNHFLELKTVHDTDCLNNWIREHIKGVFLRLQISFFTTSMLPHTKSRMPSRRRKKEKLQLSRSSDRCWFQYQCISRIGQLHQYQGCKFTLLLIFYLGDRSDSIGQTVERFAAILQTEYAELIHRTFEIMQSRGRDRPQNYMWLLLYPIERRCILGISSSLNGCSGSNKGAFWRPWKQATKKP